MLFSTRHFVTLAVFFNFSLFIFAQSCDNNNSLSGKGTATQFITGCCQTDKDCQSGCCSFLRGQCVGPIVAQERASDGGCGHGNASPNANAASALAGNAAANTNTRMVAVTTAATAATTAANTGSGAAAAAGTCQNTNGFAGKKAHNQFITGCCTSDADCAEGCCSFKRGQCVGPVVAQERAADGGCGFGNSTPNSSAAANFQKRAAATQAAVT